MIKMFPYYFVSDIIPTEQEVFDYLFPPLPLPVPYPGRIAARVIQLQYEAGVLIAEGEVEGKDQYTGQQGARDNAKNLGYNLTYQPGGIKI
jgi:hypothetical protein